MTTISIISADVGLGEAMQSYVVDGRDDDFMVVDQAKDPIARNNSVDIARKFQRSTRRPVRYISRREVISYQRAASKYSWVDAEAMQYALSGDHGAACNISMLSAGRGLLLVASGLTRFNVVGTPGGRFDSVNAPLLPGRFDPFRRDAEPVSVWASADRAHTLRVEPADALAMIDSVRDAASLGTWDTALTYKAAAARVRGGVNFRSISFVVGQMARGVPFLPGEHISGGIAGQSCWGALSGHRFELLPMAVEFGVAAVRGQVGLTISDVIEQEMCRLSLRDLPGRLIDFQVGDLETSIDSLNGYIQLRAEASASPEAVYKLDVSPEAAVEQIRRMGRLIEAWPGLLVAALDLKKNGIRLGVSV